MQKFATAFKSTKLQPQIFSLALVVLILIVIAIVVYVKVKKQKPNVAPSGVAYFAEQYAMGINNLFENTTGGKLSKSEPYIFTLFSFLIVGNLISLVGVSPITSSYSVTLTLAIVSWIGIYVVGIMYRKIKYFKKYLNPIEIIGQFTPLISLSFRIFGNIIGGTTILYFLYLTTSTIWGYIPIIGEFNLLGPIIAPPLHLYFDIFSGIIQAFVFALLTMIYWAIEAEPPSASKRKIKRSKKWQHNITN